MENMKIFINDKQINYKILGNYNKMIPIGKYNIGENVKVEFQTNQSDFSMIRRIFIL